MGGEYRTRDRSVAIELSAAGLVVDTQEMRGLTATISEDGTTVFGVLSTPPPVSSTPAPKVTGLDLFFYITINAAADSTADGCGGGRLQFYPSQYSGQKSVTLSAQNLSDLLKMGIGFGVVGDITASASSCESNGVLAALVQCGVTVGVSLRDADTAKANATAMHGIGFKEVPASVFSVLLCPSLSVCLSHLSAK